MVDEPQQKLTPRERRAQHAKSTAIKTAPGRVARKAIVPAVIVLLIAAIVTGFVLTDKAQGKCPGHWHATFDVYVQDDNGTAQRMSFRHPAFDLNGGSGYQGQTPLRAHMHQGDNKNQLHFEQGGVCVGIGEALGYVDVDLGSRSLELEGRHADLGQDGRHTASGDQVLSVYIEHVSDREYEVRNGVKVIANETLEWKKHSAGSILDYQLKDGERLLVLFGEYTDDQVAQFQAAMSMPDSGRPVR